MIRYDNLDKRIEFDRHEYDLFIIGINFFKFKYNFLDIIIRLKLIIRLFIKIRLFI